MEHYVQQNNAIDMYHSYYSGMKKMPLPEQPGCRTVNMFENPKDKRAVSSICWRPDGGHHFASSYVKMDINHKPIGITCAYIWSLHSPKVPLTTFEPSDTMLDLQYNPRDDNILGGLANGQVICFDQRAMKKPMLKSNYSMRQNKFISPACTSHRDEVRKISFINSKLGSEFFSGSSDGTLKWWYTRHMQEPTDEQILDVVDNAADEQTMAKAKVFLISTTGYNGQYAAWDMLRRQHEPIFTQQVCQEPLLKISAHEGGQLVACGSKLGKVYLIELANALTRCDKNDKSLMLAVFERESKRERILESRLREIRLKQRQAEVGGHGSPKASVTNMTIDDRDLMEANQDYLFQVKKEQATV